MTAAVLAVMRKPGCEKVGAFSQATPFRRTFSFLSPDGWYCESFGYWEFTMQYLVFGRGGVKVGHRRGFFSNSRTLSSEALHLAHMFLPNPDFTFDFGDWGPRVQADGIQAQKGYELPWHTLVSRMTLMAPFLIRTRAGPDPLMKNFLGMETVLAPHQQAGSNLFRVFWPLPTRQREPAG